MPDKEIPQGFVGGVDKHGNKIDFTDCRLCKARVAFSNGLCEVCDKKSLEYYDIRASAADRMD